MFYPKDRTLFSIFIPQDRNLVVCTVRGLCSSQIYKQFMPPHAPYMQLWREWPSSDVTKITKSPEITRETANLFDSQNFSMLGLNSVNGLGILFGESYTCA